MSEQPEGIEHAVDEGIEADDLQGGTAHGLQTPADQRQDPDQPEEAIRSATEQGRGEEQRGVEG